MNLTKTYNEQKQKNELELKEQELQKLREEMQSLQEELKAAYTKIETLNNSDLMLQQAQQLEQSAIAKKENAEKLMKEQERLQSANAEKEKQLLQLQEELRKKEERLNQEVTAAKYKAQKDAETALAAQAYELGQREEAVSRRENRAEKNLKEYKEQAQREAENSIKYQQTNLDKEWDRLAKDKENYKKELRTQALEELFRYKLLIFNALIIVGTILAAEILQNFSVYKYILSDIWQLLTHFLDIFWESGEIWWRAITTIWAAVWRWSILYLALWGLLKTKIDDWNGMLLLIIRLVPIIILTITAWRLGEKETANYIEYICLLYGIIRLYRKIKTELHKET